MTYIDECDDCQRCAGCQVIWCRSETVSPGEAWDLCVRCYEIEDPFTDSEDDA